MEDLAGDDEVTSPLAQLPPHDKSPFFVIEKQETVLELSTGRHWEETTVVWAGDYEVGKPLPPIWQLPRRLSLSLSTELTEACGPEPPSLPSVPMRFYKHDIKDVLGRTFTGYVLDSPPTAGDIWKESLYDNRSFWIILAVLANEEEPE